MLGLVIILPSSIRPGCSASRAPLAMNVVVMDFVEAARLRGERPGWIMRREILPNILPPLIAEFGLRFCFVFLTIARSPSSGVGIQPPTADWGSMVRENATLITYRRHHAAAARRRHRAADRRGQFRRRLVPAKTSGSR